MIQSFADTTTADLFHGKDTKAARRCDRALWPIVQRKLDAINAATVIGDLRVPPGNDLKAIKGEGLFSVRVNRQFRIRFRFAGGHASAVQFGDFHD